MKFFVSPSAAAAFAALAAFVLAAFLAIVICAFLQEKYY